MDWARGVDANDDAALAVKGEGGAGWESGRQEAKKVERRSMTEL